MCGRGEKEDWDAGIISGRRRASAAAATLASTDDAMEQVKVHPLSLLLLILQKSICMCAWQTKINLYVPMS